MFDGADPAPFRFTDPHPGPPHAVSTTERLIAEVKRGGSKSVVLGVLFLVLLGVGVPPVWRAVGGDAGPAVALAPLSPVTPTADAPDPGAAANAGAPADPPDRAVRSPAGGDRFDPALVARLVRTDPLLIPVPVVARDPFAAPLVPPTSGIDDAEDVPADDAAESEAPADPRPTPADVAAGVRLSGTITGGDRPLAVLGGRAVPVGGTVRFDGYRLTVASVGPGTAVLRLDDLRYPLTRDDPTAAGGGADDAADAGPVRLTPAGRDVR